MAQDCDAVALTKPAKRSVMPDTNYPRDLIGYGKDPPHADWPGGARIAIQMVLNYEEGGENCILHGDPASEAFLSDMINPPAIAARAT